ncbi:MAG: glutamate-5-semialdehyde dehydrogenase [Pseudomonadota bacterium]|nr:glutamate-5-semialdehyde dehydrogenase [Pseudomonadota bacterium]MEC9392725.1 glutamate-5-semialdehyde dehydrogenase [Pseudomonadota bacterium]MEC9459232.1 glutamate-5-semialdehyde dehydrogenase [Pseudomonadota bacterium]MED5437291.1 glutamate-5-semialdehyde dehydrogenase [Pseudomonadota bacterium]
MSKEIKSQLITIGENAKKASQILSMSSENIKNKALTNMANTIVKQCDKILEANNLDMENAKKKGISEAFLDRLLLDSKRVESISEGLRSIVELSDPVGEEIARWKRPNGLDISRVRTPLGVIGVIYESRPNVTADAGALCLKAGNAVILRGGSESFHSSAAIHNCLVKGLEDSNLPKESIQIIPTIDRDAVGYLLEGLNGNIDVIVPRGGKSLVERVQNEAKIPVFGHLEGICHLYVDEQADPIKAEEIVINAKMRRPGICGAAETLLIDEKVNKDLILKLISSLKNNGCEVRGCEKSQLIDDNLIPANREDWSTEYLDSIISLKIVNGIEDAIKHINEFSTNHTDSIITENKEIAEKFMREIDSAIVMHNASTQFADGGEFGMGAEIGIATGRFHARGPVGVEQLTSFKYVVRGSGQTRP